MSETRQILKESVKNSSESSSIGFFREIDVDFLVHELKDPVAVIEAGIRTLLERPDKFGPLSERQRRTLERALRNSRKAGRLLQELLEIGRGESGCFISEMFRPAEAVFTALVEAAESVSVELAESIAPAQTRRQIGEALQRENVLFEVSEQANQVEIVQDQRKFQQIVGNLVKNALYHRKKQVEIRVDIGPVGFIVDVRDDGPGVPASFHKQIFQRYMRANACLDLPRKGHGLGLAGARALARCLGGDILLRSGRGRGAVFRFIMPI
ncbi:MAG: HAMP domain-containing sensor histidine kinase [Desulfobacterales bacterium]|nr:HAMP domain-containing sensor histidine kinase [Desulfobacterales bacterium]